VVAEAGFEPTTGERDTTPVEIEIEINKTLNRIEVLNDKISNFDQYTSSRHLPRKQKDTIFSALESSMKEEVARLDELRESDRVLPSGHDVYQFVRAARRFGYISDIERPVLDEVVEKIYVTSKMNNTNYQQNRIIVKYKHVGIMTGIYKPREKSTLDVSKY